MTFSLWPQNRILLIKQVAPDTMGFLSVLFSAITSPVVLSRSHWFKVLRIYTSRYATQMIQLFLAWDRPLEKPIGILVGTYHRLLPKTPIAILRDRALPDPAGAKVGAIVGNRPVLIDLGPEAFFRSHRQFGTIVDKWASMPPKTKVMLSAEATSNGAIGTIIANDHFSIVSEARGRLQQCH